MKRDEVMRAMTDPVAKELLESQHVARLAYDGLDGYPRAIPIGYYWNGDQFIVCTATNAPKVAALRANPKIALTIDTETNPPHILLVRGTADVAIVDGIPSEYLAASRKYIPTEQFPEFEKQVVALYPQMARVAITPEWVKILDFETRLPSAVADLMAQRA